MRVLMATDGSADARQAQEWLFHAPLPKDTQVCVISAMPVPVAYEALEMAWADLRKQADAVVEHTRRRLAERWAPVTATVVEGDPRRVILDAAEHERADLIVVGARGLGAIATALLGSVSLGVARHASCPVLVCKGRSRPMTSITVAVDGSDHARAALRFVGRLPLPDGAAVHLVAAVEPMRFPSTVPSIIAPQVSAALRDCENECRHRLEDVLQAARAEVPGPTEVTTTTWTGAPADCILAEAQKHASDLIVVGARGLGAIKRVLLGSVSEAVLRDAPCPVLVVHPRADRG